MKNKKEKKYALPLLIIILATALALRLTAINEGLSSDEAYSLLAAKSIASGDFAGAYHRIFYGFHPPLDFALRALWGMLFGFDVLPQRILSLILGLGTIIFTYLLGKEAKDENTGLLAAFILSIMPLHIYDSIEARMYSLLIFLAVASIYTYSRHGVTWRLFLANLALLSTHYYAILVVLGELLHQAATHKKGSLGKKAWRRKQALLLTPILAYLGYLAVLLFQYGLGQPAAYLGWIQKLSIARVVQIFWRLFIGLPTFSLASVLLCACIIFLMGNAIWHHRKAQIMLLALLPIAIPFAASIFKPIIHERYLTYTLPIFAALLSYSLFQLKKPLRHILAAAFIILYLITTAAYLHAYAPPNSVEDVMERVKPRMNDSQLVILANDGIFTYEYYLGGMNFISIGDELLQSDKQAMQDSFSKNKALFFPASRFPSNEELQGQLLEFFSQHLTLQDKIELKSYILYEYRIP